MGGQTCRASRFYLNCSSDFVRAYMCAISHIAIRLSASRLLPIQIWCAELHSERVSASHFFWRANMFDGGTRCERLQNTGVDFEPPFAQVKVILVTKAGRTLSNLVKRGVYTFQYRDSYTIEHLRQKLLPHHYYLTFITDIAENAVKPQSKKFWLGGQVGGQSI